MHSSRDANTSQEDIRATYPQAHGMLGERIRKCRGDMTQRQLADLVHCTQSNVSQWESGLVEPPASRVAALAQAFRVSSDYLLGLTEDPSPRAAPSPGVPTAQDVAKATNLLRDALLLLVAKGVAEQPQTPTHKPLPSEAAVLGGDLAMLGELDAAAPPRENEPPAAAGA